MEVSGQLHVSAALPWGIKPPPRYPLDRRLGGVQTLSRREKSCPYRELKPARLTELSCGVKTKKTNSRGNTSDFWLRISAKTRVTWWFSSVPPGKYQDIILNLATADIFYTLYNWKSELLKASLNKQRTDLLLTSVSVLTFTGQRLTWTQNE
jgi:hypothetical protein